MHVLPVSLYKFYASISSLPIIQNAVPPTLNLTDIDEHEFQFNYVPLKMQERKVNVVLSNSFGFGGTNATLCFSRYISGNASPSEQQL